MMEETAKSRFSVPRIPIVGGVLSIIPGLGQVYGGFIMRGVLLFLFIASLYALSLWRMDNAGIDISTYPSYNADDLNKKQEQAFIFATLAILLTTVGYVWNIYDGYVSAGGKPSPALVPGLFITIATLIIGAHITEIDIAKAVNEIGDVSPRLKQILWPWNPDDSAFTREVETFDGVAMWETPCDDTPIRQPTHTEGESYIEIDSVCGSISGLRKPDGSRDEGTTINIKGYDFRPGEEAELVLKPGSVPEFRVVVEGERVRVIPDENGEFELSFVMPNFTIPATATTSTPVEITVRQKQEVGSLKLSEDFWLSFEGIIETLFLALMATIAGLVLAVPVSFLAARNLMSTSRITIAAYYIIRVILNVVRSIEPIVWALIAIIWVGAGPFAGVLALTIHTIASLAKLYSEAIESIDPGPIEAIQATGADRLQTIMYAVVPQVIPPFVSFTIYRWDINVRMSTIIGAVGGGGIGLVLIQWIRLAKYDSVGIAVWMIAIVVTILDYASARIREQYV
ncbi:MAG: phosphonate ABC transporter, permease protein PhnE [Anaerolineae bacterium]|nr:phosphonate ABC transporter, permease protein PhnE [Anaerolineae bacterium]